MRKEKLNHKTILLEGTFDVIKRTDEDSFYFDFSEKFPYDFLLSLNSLYHGRIRSVKVKSKSINICFSIIDESIKKKIKSRRDYFFVTNQEIFFYLDKATYGCVIRMLEDWYCDILEVNHLELFMNQLDKPFEDPKAEIINDNVHIEFVFNPNLKVDTFTPLLRI